MSKFFVVCCVLVPAVLSATVPGADNEVFQGRDLLTKMMDDCEKSDLTTCLGVKAVAMLNRIGRMDNVKLLDGISFVRHGEVDRSARALSEAELENSLPEEPMQKSSRLFDMFLEAAVKFFKTHSLQMKLSDGSSADLQRALDEGRGKLKKVIGPIVVGVIAKIAALIPLVLGGLALLAKKALIISKLAFIIAAILALQKVLGHHGGHGGGLGGFSSKQGPSREGWSSSGSHSSSGGAWSSSGGPYYRSFNENASAQDMAYNAQAPAQ